MTNGEKVNAGHNLDARFRETEYSDHLRSMPRWSRYMPINTTGERWRSVLHADSDGLDQARLMINLAQVFLRQDTDNTTELSTEEKELLMKAVAAQNWGKSYDDDLNVSQDISYEFITGEDIEHRKRKFHHVYQELVPEASIKERFIVERTIYDRDTKIGRVFDAIRRLSCLRTGLIAYDKYSQDPQNYDHQELGALSLGVLANQLVPLIGYAEQYTPVKAALAATEADIDAIFADQKLRYSPLVNNQQSLDSIDRAQMIWDRAYRSDEEGRSTDTHQKETIFSQGSLFERRFIQDKNQLKQVVDGLRAAGMKIALTSGSFDLLHVGHAAYIEKASEFGDILVIGVDSDDKIRKRKGESRPIVHQEERVRLLSHLRGAGIITLKDPDEKKWNLINLVRPDVLVVTAETYSSNEIRELEEKYCERVVVLEPQATTSTGAQIRKIEIGAIDKREQIGSEISRRILDALSNDSGPVDQLATIKEIVSNDK